MPATRPLARRSPTATRALRQHRAALEAGASPEIVTGWALGDLVIVLCEADPADKAEVYGQLGLSLTYDPARKRVRVEA